MRGPPVVAPAGGVFVGCGLRSVRFGLCMVVSGPMADDSRLADSLSSRLRGVAVMRVGVLLVLVGEPCRQCALLQ